MRPLVRDFWGSLSRQLLAGLTLLLAAAVLSVMLFPAAHGSFVVTHGPATAFRSRRLFLAIHLFLAILITMVRGDSYAAQLVRQFQDSDKPHAPGPAPLVLFALPAVLQC